MLPKLIAYYQHISETYCNELKSSLTPFSPDKILFCLNRICQWFQEKYDNFTDNSDYTRVINIISSVEKMKQQKDEELRNAIPLIQFWTALNAWLDNEAQNPAVLYRTKYQECYPDCGRWVTVGSVDNNALYRATYGKPYIDINEQNISSYAIKEFIEAYYNLLIKNFLNLLLYDFYDYQAKELLLAKLCLNFGNIYTTVHNTLYV